MTEKLEPPNAYKAEKTLGAALTAFNQVNSCSIELSSEEKSTALAILTSPLEERMTHL